MLYSVYPYIHWNYPPHAHSALRILRCGAAAPVGGRLRQDHHGGEGAAHHIPHHQVGGPPPIFGGIDRRGGARERDATQRNNMNTLSKKQISKKRCKSDQV